MAGRMKLEIAESTKYLEKSLKHARTAAQKERLQMLWWVKSGQVNQHQELATRLSFSHIYCNKERIAKRCTGRGFQG